MSTSRTATVAELQQIAASDHDCPCIHEAPCTEPAPIAAVTDPRYVYGLSCTWHDRIGNVAHRGSGLPCCPGCGSVLFEMESADMWWRQVQAYAPKHPGYEALLRWSQGQCFPNIRTLEAAYSLAMEGAN